MAPTIDEDEHHFETPVAMAAGLAFAKAQSIAQKHPDAVVIGSDQVAELDSAVLGKPGDNQRAVAQLRSLSGHVHYLHTAVTIFALSANRGGM